MKLRNLVFKNILSVLNKYHYCILRNYEYLPYIKNDIDILVKKKDINNIIFELSFKLKKINVVFIKKVYFSCISLYFYDKISKQIIHIDLFTDLKWKIFEYLPADEILKKRKKYKNFYIPSNYYEFHELLFTKFIYKRQIKELYKNKILSLANSINKKENSRKILYLNIKISNNINFSKLEKKINLLRFKIIFYNFLNIRKLIKNIINFFIRSIKRIINPPGLFIAFYGVDGSGKTTQIKLLTNFIHGLFSDKVRIFHFRPKYIYKKPSKIVIVNPHDQLKTNIFRSLIKLIYYIFIFNWGFYTQILPILIKNGLIIFDRYYYDLIIDPKRYRINIPNWMVKFGGKLIRKPEINILLISNAKNIYKRKPELKFYEIINQQNILKKEFSQKNNFIVKTDIDKEKSFNNLRNIIIDYVKSKN